jgi:predicted dithiol-disulfide oxidoreductase (DUF899 family)
MDTTLNGTSIADHPVVSRERWLAERKALLAREKEAMRLHDQIARERRALPWDRVDTPYQVQAFPAEEAPGISVFYRDDADDVFHTYSTYGRGVEVMMGAYPLMDLVPLGRGERDVPNRMEWVRHHDRYEPAEAAAQAKAASCCSHG